MVRPMALKAIAWLWEPHWANAGEELGNPLSGARIMDRELETGAAPPKARHKHLGRSAAPGLTALLIGANPNFVVRLGVV